MRKTFSTHLFLQVYVLNWDDASSWITAIPVIDFRLNLYKQAFCDALCLRYGWPFSRLPSHDFCGVPFSINHAFTCPKGAFPIIRNNRIRDQLADLLTEVCPCVLVEPVLRSLSGEQFQLRSTNVEDNARINVSAQEFYDRRRMTAFLMSRCSMPMLPAPPQLPHAIIGMNWRKGGSMREEWLRLSMGHSPHFSSGGMGPSATVSVKTLASLLAEKSDTPILWC